MAQVFVRENESLESALKRFKRSCARDGVMAEVRKREHYEKPSVKRKKKSEAARKKARKYYCHRLICDTGGVPGITSCVHQAGRSSASSGADPSGDEVRGCAWQTDRSFSN